MSKQATNKHLSDNKTKSKPKKQSHKKELLIALLISLALLGVVIGATFLYQSYRNVTFEPIAMIIGDAVGFLITFAIVYHFVKKPDDGQP